MSDIFHDTNSMLADYLADMLHKTDLWNKSTIFINMCKVFCGLPANQLHLMNGGFDLVPKHQQDHLKKLVQIIKHHNLRSLVKVRAAFHCRLLVQWCCWTEGAFRQTGQLGKLAHCEKKCWNYDHMELWNVSCNCVLWRCCWLSEPIR